FATDLNFHFAKYICRFGEVESLFDMYVPASSPTKFVRTAETTDTGLRRRGPADLKTAFLSLHQSILIRAKAEGNPSIDLLGRLAVLKFIRADLQSQYSKILEQCRMKSKAMEGLRHTKMVEMQELVSSFRIRKKIIIRRAGQEVLRLLRVIEKETLARTRRSLLGDSSADSYRLLLNPLILTEDGRDDYLCAEHYYMFGNFEQDADRFPPLRHLAIGFLRELGYGEDLSDEDLEPVLNVPDNADALVGTGSGEDATPEDRNRKDRLELWTRQLQRAGVLPQIIASYEAVPLLNEYARCVNPQQLKNALINRAEAERVEKIIAEARLSPDRLFAAIDRVDSCRGSERERFAARLLHDLFCYHRDLRSLEVVNSGFDSINLVSDSKTRELSAVNRMLYEFLPPEDQKPAEDKVLHHVVLKADIRDSSRLTRSLMEKGLNAASYFSLNFYDPINKLLAKYGATKVFLEGDAIIVALMEREGEPMLSVGRTCVLAWEIVSLLREYNELLERSGLPPMEVGLGIAYQDSPPLYLMDGERHIMISDAINESDRLSSCSKTVRKMLAEEAGVFQVYRFDAGAAGESSKADDAAEETAVANAGIEDLRLSYNVGGICLSEAAFEKLREEISLDPCFSGLASKTPGKTSSPWPVRRWTDPKAEFFLGTVPIANGAFRKIVIRKSRVAQVDVRDLSIQQWTNRCYYEVCANPAVYSVLPGERTTAANK
ncbi:MAG: hypothetical protein ACREF8_06730, partial [Chthoniobacterales bacterium]